MYFLLKGLVVGFSIAAPVGAIGFLCIQQTLKSGIRVGIATGLGAATADMMYGILVALGMRALQVVLLSYRVSLTVGGGVFICYLGLKKFFAQPNISKVETGAESLLNAYVTTFFLTLTNPATIIDFTALFVSLNIDMSGYTESLSFIGGVFVGSAVWWLFLSFTVGIFRSKVSNEMLRYINYFAGTVIFSFGVYAIAKLYLN